MNDMSSTIVPRSDQINADDLLAGPRTITVESVMIKQGADQPVAIVIRGDRKVFRPGKSMCRVMVACWGPDANEYSGRSMTLYRDPKVKWGGMEVGGIRISHMTDLKGNKAHTMALTETKGSKKLFTVEPLRGAPQPEPKLDTTVPSSLPPVEKSPAERARDYVDKFMGRIAAVATVEAYNDIIGNETVGIRLDSLKRSYPEMRKEIDASCEDALLRLTGTGPLPQRGPPIEDDEVPF